MNIEKIKEINEEELLNLDNINRARVLKYIVLGNIKYIGKESKNGN